MSVYLKSGEVYVASHPGSDSVKVGLSKDLDRRVKSFKNQRGDGATVFYAVKVLDVYWIEKTAHRLLRPWRTNSEWYQCSPLFAAIAVDRARQFWITSRSDYSKLYCRLAPQHQLDRIGRLIHDVRELQQLEWRSETTKRRIQKLEKAISLGERSRGKLTIRVKAWRAA